MFWKALDDLHRWQRQFLPEAESPQGTEILIWLLKGKGKSRPLKDLYRSSRFSEPTLRACLRSFIDCGLVEFEVNGRDMRNRLARVTPKFEETVEAYRKQFGTVAQILDAIEDGGQPEIHPPARPAGQM
jgi:DNA-binding MarR family transcriptional regulator